MNKRARQGQPTGRKIPKSGLDYNMRRALPDLSLWFSRTDNFHERNLVKVTMVKILLMNKCMSAQTFSRNAHTP